MRRVIGWTLVLLLAAAFLGIAHAVGAGQAPKRWPGLNSGLAQPEVLAKADLQYYWRLKVPLKRSESLRRLWRLDENLYCLTTRNRLIALDAMRGLFKWSIDVAKPAAGVYAPCHADEVRLPAGGGITAILDPPDLSEVKPFNAVIVHTIGYALVIDRDTGRQARKLDFKFVANTPASSDGTHLYIGSLKGWYHAVRLSDGLKEWTKATGGMMSAKPVVHKQSLYVGSRDTKFYCVRTASREKPHLWTRKTDGPLTANFVVDARGCFVPAQDGRLYAYDNLTGVNVWTFRTRGSLRTPVQVGAISAFQYAEKDRLYAINLANGRKRWDLPAGRAVLAAIKPHVYVLTDKRTLLAVHETLGKVEASIPMRGMHLFVPNATSSAVYGGTVFGDVFCIAPKSLGHITPDMLKDKPKPTP